MEKGFDPVKIKTIKHFLISREKSRTELKAKERADILLTLKSQTQIWKKFKIDTVYLYGSFVDMSFTSSYDIDIAVSGDIDNSVFSALFAHINKPFKRVVDIRLLSELPFRKKVEKEGIIIYERKIYRSEKRDFTRPKKA